MSTLRETWRGWLRVAFRDLRGDLRRFTILLACLALGVGTITIVGSVSAALQSALLRDARVLLGGDLDATLSYRAANPDETALLRSLGTLSAQVEVLGRAASATDSAFISIRAVDGNYPLVGTATVEASTATIPELTAREGDRFGLVADALLLDRLHVGIGDTVTIENARFVVRGVIGSLPDQLTNSIGIGIPVLMSTEALGATGIIEPGVLAQFHNKLLLNPGVSFEAAAETIRTAFPSAGFQINAPRDATADLARFFDIFGRFLIVVGLSSLLVGGVGVSNAIAAYVTERQRSIATMKALGATGGQIMAHFLFQVLLLTAVGIGLGLILGGALTLLALPILGGLLQLALPAVLDPGTLATAAGFGLLVGFAFGYLPLRRAQKLKPALLFRSAGSAVEGGLGWRDYLRPGLWLPLAIAALGIFGLAALTTGRPVLVLWYAAAVLGAFRVLRGAAWLLQVILRLVPPLGNAAWRNALKSIHRPGAPAPVVILSLGLGLALLLLIALIDGNLRHQLSRESIPNAPSFVFMDLFEDEAQALDEFSKADPAQVADFRSVPMMRGKIESVNGVPVAELGRTLPPEFNWVFEAEIPLTSSPTLPEDSTLTQGAWWPDNYDGVPEVSVFDRLREPLGLKLGDELKLLVFGQEITARVASFRDYAWRSGNVNFGFVFSPNAFADFDISYLGFMKAAPGAERALQTRLVGEFPDLLFLPVGEALESFARILGNVTAAVEVIGGLAVASGVLVLAGAMAAGRRQREADAVVMKVLGASRGDVVRAYLVEYGLLGLLAAVLAAGLGLAGPWAVVEFVLDIGFWVDPRRIGWVVLGTVALTVAVGTLTTWSALSTRPARFLREE
jgi:putative ABC transport system permease protein